MDWAEVEQFGRAAGAVGAGAVFFFITLRVAKSYWQFLISAPLEELGRLRQLLIAKDAELDRKDAEVDAERRLRREAERERDVEHDRRAAAERRERVLARRVHQLTHGREGTNGSWSD